MVKELSPHTLKARQSDQRLFVDWLNQRGIESPPANPGIVVEFIHAMLKDRALSTVRRYLSSLSAWYADAGDANPTRDPMVKNALKEASRIDAGEARRGVRPINRATLDRLIRAAPDTLRGKRDRALVMVAYDTLLRTSELAALNLEEIRFDGNGFAIVTLPGQASPPRREERVIVPDACQALREWLRSAAIHAGPVFLSIDKGDRIGGRLSERGAVRAFKRLARQGGLDPEGISGLSCRIGAAQDMMAEGFRVGEVMRAGGWRSPVALARYAEPAFQAGNPVARLASHQGRV